MAFMSSVAFDTDRTSLANTTITTTAPPSVPLGNTTVSCQIREPDVPICASLSADATESPSTASGPAARVAVPLALASAALALIALSDIAAAPVGVKGTVVGSPGLPYRIKTINAVSFVTFAEAHPIGTTGAFSCATTGGVGGGGEGGGSLLRLSSYATSSRRALVNFEIPPN